MLDEVGPGDEDGDGPVRLLDGGHRQDPAELVEEEVALVGEVVRMVAGHA